MQEAWGLGKTTEVVLPKSQRLKEKIGGSYAKE